MCVNKTYFGDQFAINTNIESFCCIPETNVICQLCLNKNKLRYNHTEESYSVLKDREKVI